MVFLPTSVGTQKIKEDQTYEGLRVTLKGTLGTVNVPIQLDIGTGDVITPAAKQTESPTILTGLPAPVLSVYSRESVLAEKLEAMVKLDLANSRMKDFYDMWVITSKLGFDGALLEQAISATFNRRKTIFPSEGIPALSSYFYNDKNKNIQWYAFLKKGRVKYNKLTLPQVCEDIRNKLKPILESVGNKI